MTDDPAIELNQVCKIYGDTREALKRLGRGEDKKQILEQTGIVVALNAIDLRVEAGELFVIMGLSGSGKSTLIRLLNALIPPSSGKVMVRGRDIAALRTRELRQFRARHVSMVFQHFGLLPHRTVLQNVMYGLRIQGIARTDAATRAMHWIRQVGLDHFESRYPSDLSGGMRQRVGLARALATDAEIMLMDEAFSALDPLIRHEMQELLLELQKRLQKTVVFITHDLDEALRLGNRVAILNQGSIIQIGTPLKMLSEPANDFIRSFLNRVDRSKILKAKHIMTTISGGGLVDHRHGAPVLYPAFPRRIGPSVGQDMPLDTILALAFRSAEPIAVEDDEGRLVGWLDRDDLVRAISPEGAPEFTPVKEHAPEPHKLPAG